MKSGILMLPYFKQGDDLHEHLQTEATVEDALEAHARQLEHATAILRTFKKEVAGQPVEVEADTHQIIVSGPPELIDGLIESGILEAYTSAEDDDLSELDELADLDADDREYLKDSLTPRG